MEGEKQNLIQKFTLAWRKKRETCVRIKTIRHAKSASAIERRAFDLKIEIRRGGDLLIKRQFRAGRYNAFKRERWEKSGKKKRRGERSEKWNAPGWRRPEGGGAGWKVRSGNERQIWKWSNFHRSNTLTLRHSRPRGIEQHFTTASRENLRHDSQSAITQLAGDIIFCTCEIPSSLGKIRLRVASSLSIPPFFSFLFFFFFCFFNEVTRKLGRFQTFDSLFLSRSLRPIEIKSASITWLTGLKKKKKKKKKKQHRRRRAPPVYFQQFTSANVYWNGFRVARRFFFFSSNFCKVIRGKFVYRRVGSVHVDTHREEGRTM